MVTPIDHPAGRRLTLEGEPDIGPRSGVVFDGRHSTAVRRLRSLVALGMPIVAVAATWPSSVGTRLVAVIAALGLSAVLLSVNSWAGRLGSIGVRVEIGVDAAAALFVALLFVGRLDGVAWLVLSLPIVEAAIRLPDRAPTVVVAGVTGGFLAASELVGFGQAEPERFGPLVHLVVLSAVALVAVVFSTEARLESRLVVHASLESRRRAHVLGAVAAAACQMNSSDTRALVDVVVDLGHRLGADRVSAIEKMGGRWVTVSPSDVPVMAVERAASEAVLRVGGTVETTVAALDNVPSGHPATEVIVAVPVIDDIVVVVAGPELPGSVTVEAMEIVAEQAGLAIERTRALAEAEALREELVHRVGTDDMTGLVNRGRFRELLLERSARGDSEGYAFTALLYIDLDGFKDVNDEFGHDAGDRLLVAVAKRLEGVIRPGDVAARHGGDEFTVLLGSVSSARDVEAVANRVLGALTQPFRFRDITCAVGASVGAALAEGSDDVVDLMAKADAAMYRAKRAGGDRVVLHEE